MLLTRDLAREMRRRERLTLGGGARMVGKGQRATPDGPTEVRDTAGASEGTDLFAVRDQPARRSTRERLSRIEQDLRSSSYRARVFRHPRRSHFVGCRSLAGRTIGG